MNFELSEEQKLLRESVERFIQKQYDFDNRYQLANSEQGYSIDNWKQFAELGWLSIPFAEDNGGFGGNVIDVATIMQEFGKGLVIEPFVTSVVLAGQLLENSENSNLKQQYIESIIEGNCHIATALFEPQSRYEWSDVTTTATVQSDGSYQLNGSKALVSNAPNSNALIISARTSGNSFDEQGISLFCVDIDSAGVILHNNQLMDGQPVADIELSHVNVSTDAVLGSIDNAADIIKSALQFTIIALCAEALGIMEKLNRITIEYAQTRKQFGTTIGSFQALQHRMVDSFIAYEQTRSMLFKALCDFTAETGTRSQEEIDSSIHALKMLLGKNSKLIGGEAIQIHGGIGLTDELNVGHYFKRLMMINMTFGDADYHQRCYNQLNYSKEPNMGFS